MSERDHGFQGSRGARSESLGGASKHKLLTSTEAARVLGASATSVKRWADEGLLPCVRTAGNHRRFTREALEAFAEANSPDHSSHSRSGVARSPRAATPSTPPEALGSRFELPEEVLGNLIEELLHSNNHHRLQARLLQLRAESQSWAEVCDRLGPVLDQIGARWVEGEISVIEEHLASERFARGLARIAESLHLAPSAPPAMLATVDGDEHTLGLSLVELSLREIGWQTLWSGRHTPVTGLPHGLADQGVKLLAVSASRWSSDPMALSRRASELAEICRGAGVGLLLGGNGAWPETPRYGFRIRSCQEIGPAIAQMDLPGISMA